MAKAKYIAFIGLVIAFRISGAAANPSVDLGALADNVGVINAWKLIPETLLSRCINEFPAKSDSLGRTYESWRAKHQGFSSEMGKVLAEAAPILAPALGVGALDARQKIDDFTRTLIEENYLSGGKPALKDTCDRYDTIVNGLSEPGRLATVRGLMYHVESIVHDQKQPR